MNSTPDNFVREDPWRIFRIMAEFVDSFETLSAAGQAVTIFGSARTPSTDPYYKLAVEIAQGLAKHNLAVITGGQVVSEDLGLKLEDVTEEYLGTCAKIKVPHSSD